jgi:hypothetical protein
MWPYELRQLPRRGTRYVRYWHKADMLNPLANVRFWGQSGHDSNGAVMSANDPKRTFHHRAFNSQLRT